MISVMQVKKPYELKFFVTVYCVTTKTLLVSFKLLFKGVYLGYV
jgi:hypothetical protein